MLRRFNPWWSSREPAGLPDWRRSVFQELVTWADSPPAGRVLLLSGARQVGKTTLMLQLAQHLLMQAVAPGNILYVTFDHPLLRLSGLDRVIETWRELETESTGPQFLLLDEIQSLEGWSVWIKHQVDFEKTRRIAITGSASALNMETESGVGRWYTVRLPTLSFFEYLHIRRVPYPELPVIRNLREIADWSEAEISHIAHEAAPLAAQFHEYLLRGGFPQCALVDDLSLSQKLLREDIIEKVLKRDMTALFGVRRILELEQLFLYLCLTDGGIVDYQTLQSNLSVKKPTILNYLDLLESTHLVYRLMPFGYGKEVLRGKPKLFLADPAISGAVLLKGKSLLEDATALGRAVEAAFFKHVFTRYYRQAIYFSYWKNKKGQEIDIIASIEGRQVPFEVKYRESHTSAKDSPGLVEFCERNKVDVGYLITRGMADMRALRLGKHTVMKIPAALACFWLSK